MGVYPADLEANGTIDIAVADPLSNWDWMPDTGHFTLQLAASPVGGIIVPESSLPADTDDTNHIYSTRKRHNNSKDADNKIMKIRQISLNFPFPFFFLLFSFLGIFLSLRINVPSISGL
ncbi:MAG: hypothetical protein QXH24_05920 [Candidatus Bathyarchaeia archaeon]